MAELDYAYLADYAQIEGGKISALGASYTHAVVNSLPAGWMTTVVGRVRAEVDEPPVPLTITTTPPTNSYELRHEGVLERGAEVRPYRGRVGLLFTVTFHLPVLEEGLYSFDVSLANEHVRRLAFDVEVSARR